MTSSRPYLIRALHEWIVDNGHVPHLLVDATQPGVVVPEAFVRDGQIILNVGYTAVQGLQMDNEAVSFNARFSGQPMEVYVPIEAVKAIYDRENGRGMMFADEPGAADGSAAGAPAAEADAESEDKPEGGKEKGRPNLKVIK